MLRFNSAIFIAVGNSKASYGVFIAPRPLHGFLVPFTVTARYGTWREGDTMRRLMVVE